MHTMFLGTVNPSGNGIKSGPFLEGANPDH